MYRHHLLVLFYINFLLSLLKEYFYSHIHRKKPHHEEGLGTFHFIQIFECTYKKKTIQIFHFESYLTVKAINRKVII